ncbi:MAG: DUF1697 domain-containing protein [Xanthomonadales bacterium]|nr:DUF1697 domain-containing protein [Xanthomonadales bacterium]
MKTYVLLFRGINVGGKNKMTMKDLSSLLEEMGFCEVKTYIQSGNVVLKSKERPDESIQLKIASKFGFNIDIMILEKAEFERSLNNNPYNSIQGKEIHFYFTQKVPQPDFEKISSLASENEKYELNGNVFYLYAPDGIGRSKLVANIDKCLGVSATGRNLNTINKLGEMVTNI